MSEQKLHRIKLRIEFCDVVYYEIKTFEIRKNDRDYNRFDLVEFIPVDEFGEAIHHDIEKQVYMIRYILQGWGLNDGYVAFSIEPLQMESIDKYKISQEILK